VGKVADPAPDTVPSPTEGVPCRALSELFRLNVASAIRELGMTLTEVSTLQITNGMRLVLGDAAAKETARRICRITEREIQGEAK